jgi:pimeloyl-ACP methyl ester carboxylesterase
MLKFWKMFFLFKFIFQTFRVYKSQKIGEEEEDEDGREHTLILLHGGGLSSMSWAVCSVYFKTIKQ